MVDAVVAVYVPALQYTHTVDPDVLVIEPMGQSAQANDDEGR